MKIWITGIAGFLGSHLADELLNLDHQVYGNDNFLCGDINNVPVRDIGSAILCDDSNGDENFSLDCCDFDLMQTGIKAKKIDVLIHCAATAHEGLSNFSPSFITRNIYEASVSTFSAAISAGVKRIIFMSSMARYGRQSLPFHEAQTPHPIDPYGIAKVAAEQTLKALCELHSVEYVIVVPHNIIGERQKYDDPYRNVASIMINRALQGKPIFVYGDGLQKRCFSPLKDCMHSLLKMIDAPISGETINIGPDHDEITVLDLASAIQDLTGGKSEIQHLPDRPNEVKNAWCTSSKAERLLGYKRQQSLRACLGEMILYIKEHGVKEFQYNFPLEIEKDCPKVWKEKML